MINLALLLSLTTKLLCVVACGGHTNGTSGTIASPNFGTLNYTLSTACLWTITVPTNMSIEIVWTAINMEPTYDYISVKCFLAYTFYIDTSQMC